MILASAFLARSGDGGASAENRIAPTIKQFQEVLDRFEIDLSLFPGPAGS